MPYLAHPLESGAETPFLGDGATLDNSRLFRVGFFFDQGERAK